MGLDIRTRTDRHFLNTMKQRRGLKDTKCYKTKKKKKKVSFHMHDTLKTNCEKNLNKEKKKKKNSKKVLTGFEPTSTIIDES